MNTLPHITQEELDLIDQYLNKQLSIHERDAFEKRVQNDKEWKEKVEAIRAVSVGIQEAALRESLPLLHKERNRSLTPVKRLSWIKMAAAAILIGIISTIGWMILGKNSGEKLYAEFHKPDPGLATEMGVTDNYEFSRAMVDYKTGNFKNALGRWQKLLLSNQQSDTLNYFIGVAYLESNEPSKAVTYLNKVAENEQSAFNDEALWYSGLAYLALNNKTSAAAVISKSHHPQKDALLMKLK